MTALSVMRVAGGGLAPPVACSSTAPTYWHATEDQTNALRGDDIGMVFQEPMTALNLLKIDRLAGRRGHPLRTRVRTADAEAQARLMLDRVGLPEAGKIPSPAIRTCRSGWPALVRGDRHCPRAEAQSRLSLMSRRRRSTSSR